MKHFTKKLSILLLLLITISCGSSDKESIKVAEEPSEKLIRSLKHTNYSIVLNDMNVKEKDETREFQHKYHILKVIEDSLVVDSLNWKTVNQDFFEKHENDLGMEIVSHHDNKLSKIAQPVGFGWAIGNEKYGEWIDETTKDSTTTQSTTNSNRRIWRSHGPSLLFWYWMLKRPAYQSHYRANNIYRASGKSYYGTNSNGTSTYGTNSSYQKTKRASFFSRKSNSTSWKSFSSSKKSRSSSRYKSSSSTRSRSGGIGK